MLKRITNRLRGAWLGMTLGRSGIGWLITVASELQYEYDPNFRVRQNRLGDFLHSRLSEHENGELLAEGMAASMGMRIGRSSGWKKVELPTDPKKVAELKERVKQLYEGLDNDLNSGKPGEDEQNEHK